MNSALLQLNSWCLLEYEYLSLERPTDKALKLFSSYTNENYFLNSVTSKTQNSLNTTSIRLGNDSLRWVDLDPRSTPVSIIQNDMNLQFSSPILGNSVKYDKIRLHLLSGFPVPEGFIFEVSLKEKISGNSMNLCSYTWYGDIDTVQFNSKPLFLTDRYYDRFVEIWIPAAESIFAEQRLGITISDNFSVVYSTDGGGFSENSLLDISFFEIVRSETQNGLRFFYTSSPIEASLTYSDSFRSVSAVIFENPEFDFIEYYPTYNGGFIEDFITTLNVSGTDWVIINTIEVYEQLGSSFVKTFNMTSLQEDEYGSPNYFRPVIKNAGVAISFTVEYTMRMFNRATTKEIVRRASFSSLNPKKYGKSLKKINVLEDFKPIKVYNKIIKSETDRVNFVQKDSNIPKFLVQKTFINSWFDIQYISVDSSNSTEATLGKTLWAQGQNTIYLNSYDNSIKFKMFGNENSLDLSSQYSMLRLSFILDDGTKIYFEPKVEKFVEPQYGDVLFVVPSEFSGKILASKNKNYYILQKNLDGTETVLYFGKYEHVSTLSTASVSNTLVSNTLVSNTVSKVAEVSKKLTTFLESKQKIQEQKTTEIETPVLNKIIKPKNTSQK